MQSPILEAKNISKSFGNIEVLVNLSFKVLPGEFVYITGPSGSGKTTLLRMILRDLLADSGELVFDAQEVSRLKKKEVVKLRRKMGVVFQDYKVLPERTVKENIEMALAVLGVNENEWLERVNQVLRLVGLDQRSGFFPRQLSGGELQRVSLGRALVVNPKLILADEPTGNLDWNTSKEIMDLFAKINSEGKTILMATHHRALIDYLKKREIVLASHVSNISGQKPSKRPSKKTK